MIADQSTDNAALTYLGSLTAGVSTESKYMLVGAHGES